MDDFEDVDDRSEFDKLPPAVAIALESALLSQGVPPLALACYARWWQLETYLRLLVYIELRSAYGMDWSDLLDKETIKRQSRDEKYQYMASPDWYDPLAFLDASKLFEITRDNWELFERVLPVKAIWDGRTVELVAIRNRIGHLRRPHADDLTKLEQSLRDLEHGAFITYTSYNRAFDVDSLSAADPVVAAWHHDEFPNARGLVAHAVNNHSMWVSFTYSVRPWAEFPEIGAPGSGVAGGVWNLGLHARRDFSVKKFWRELAPSTRQILAHVLADSPPDLRVTIPAADDTGRVLDALGDVLRVALQSVTMEEASVEFKSKPNMDSRVHLNTPLSMVDESMTPITFFSA